MRPGRNVVVSLAAGVIVGAVAVIGFQSATAGPYRVVTCDVSLQDYERSAQTCPLVEFPDKPRKWDAVPNCGDNGLPPSGFLWCRP